MYLSCKSKKKLLLLINEKKKSAKRNSEARSPKRGKEKINHISHVSM